MILEIYSEVSGGWIILGMRKAVLKILGIWIGVWCLSRPVNPLSRIIWTGNKSVLVQSRWDGVKLNTFGFYINTIAIIHIL